jgi:predicted DsbA family dithiol-disulfide isomerase
MQDAMWSFVELIYRNQGPESNQDWLTDDLMAEAAGKLGLDVDAWKAAYAGTQVEENFLANQSAAQSDKVTQTPTFVVKGPRGQRAIVGAVNVSDLQAAINEVGPAT